LGWHHNEVSICEYMLHVYTYAIHVILIVSVVCNSFLVTNCNKKLTFFPLVPLPPLIFFVPKKNSQMLWKLYQQNFSLSVPKAPHKKAFKTHLKQKKMRKDPQPTNLDFQNSNHLHDT